MELLRQTYGKPFTLVCPVADGGALLRGCKATVQAFDEEIRVVAAVADGQNADAAFQADSRFDVTLPQIEEAKALALEQEGVRLGDESCAALFAAANLAATDSISGARASAPTAPCWPPSSGSAYPLRSGSPSST